MCLTKLGSYVKRLLNTLIFKIQNILTCVSADRNIVCVCMRVLCTLFWGVERVGGVGEGGVTGGSKAKFTPE